MSFRRPWRPLDRERVDQVANLPDRLAHLEADPSHLVALRAAWAPLLHSAFPPTVRDSLRDRDEIIDY